MAVISVKIAPKPPARPASLFVISYERKLTNGTKILNRVANCTLTLAASNLAFRDRKEEAGQSSSGTVVAISIS